MVLRYSSPGEAAHASTERGEMSASASAIVKFPIALLGFSQIASLPVFLSAYLKNKIKPEPASKEPGTGTTIWVSMWEEDEVDTGNVRSPDRKLGAQISHVRRARG